MEVRAIRRDEVAAWQATMRVGFHSDPPSDPAAVAEELAGRIDLARTIGAFEGDRVVATYRSFTTELTVPGGAVRACAVSNVTVLPTHRRRGLLRQMMRDDLAGAIDRREPIAVLVASEWPIYGRFGFGPATDAAGFELRPRETRFVREGSGTVELVTPEEFVAAAPGVFDAHRRASPGEVAREGWRWDVQAGLAEGWQQAPPGTRLALVRDDGGAVRGMARWHVRDDWSGHRPHSVLGVDELLAADPDGTPPLWRFLAGVDLVETVRAGQRGVDEVLPWLV